MGNLFDHDRLEPRRPNASEHGAKKCMAKVFWRHILECTHASSWNRLLCGTGSQARDGQEWDAKAII